MPHGPSRGEVVMKQATKRPISQAEAEL